MHIHLSNLKGNLKFPRLWRNVLGWLHCIPESKVIIIQKIGGDGICSHLVDIRRLFQIFSKSGGDDGI